MWISKRRPNNFSTLGSFFSYSCKFHMSICYIVFSMINVIEVVILIFRVLPKVRAAQYKDTGKEHSQRRYFIHLL